MTGVALPRYVPYREVPGMEQLQAHIARRQAHTMGNKSRFCSGYYLSHESIIPECRILSDAEYALIDNKQPLDAICAYRDDNMYQRDVHGNHILITEEPNEDD